jgi:hypothetical protein
LGWLGSADHQASDRESRLLRFIFLGFRCRSSTLAGWYTAEVGRRVAYGVLRTASVTRHS